MSDDTRPLQIINNPLPVKNASWRALQIFSLYRLLLAISLVAMVQFQPSATSLGSHQPKIFDMVSFVFLALAFANQITTYYRAHFALQIQFQVLSDIILLTLLMHASGGVSSGLGTLIAVSTTAVSILINKTSALVYSIIASLVVLAEEIYSNYYGIRPNSGITQVGILDVTILGTGLTAFYLSRRIRETEHKAEQSIRGLASMEKLNEEIIQYMSTGVIVIDEFQKIRLINRSAWAHLGMPESTQSKSLDQVASPLARQLSLWRRKNHYRAKPFRNTTTGPNLLPHFSPIGESKENAIIFLDDTSVLTQQAQNLKLASLGRLTASIAHEIRNPLGALSHAAQLLKESELHSKGNLDLVEIVEKNALRVNEIIENVMQLSIRKPGQVKQINLIDYLNKMIEEYLITKKHKPKISLQYQVDNILIQFDVTQLSQILSNLMDNGLRYSELNCGSPELTIMVGVEPNNRMPFIDVIDKGEGIPPKQAENIFEPFYTTHNAGTGLGLYISRELCEANRARLDYIALTSGGSCFRISFSTLKSTAS
ncbi:MAG: HAMP domain-containing sensor histidine kinase [Enterobacterales bacterium]|nr:HAMP domain-containing sensor histidine kinase [Enterobacterales bacterium]